MKNGALYLVIHNSLYKSPFFLDLNKHIGESEHSQSTSAHDCRGSERNISRLDSSARFQLFHRSAHCMLDGHFRVFASPARRFATCTRCAIEITLLSDVRRKYPARSPGPCGGAAISVAFTRNALYSIYRRGGVRPRLDECAPSSLRL